MYILLHVYHDYEFSILPGVIIPVLTHWQYDSRESIAEGIICDDIGP